MHKTDTEQLLVTLRGGAKTIVEWARPLWLAGADAERPLRLDFAVKLNRPDATGMPTEIEGTELDNLSFRFNKLLPRGARAEHAMTITGAGEKVFVYYMSPRCGLVFKGDTRATLDAALAKLPNAADHTFKATWTDDPAWTKLLSIFEAHDPRQWLADMAQMMHLAKKGDAIHGRRTVTHRVLFDSADNARDFLREVRKLNFKPDGGPKDSGDGRHLVVFARAEPTIAIWHMHPVVLSAKALAIKSAGTYQRWETDFIQSLVPPPLQQPGGKG